MVSIRSVVVGLLVAPVSVSGFQAPHTHTQAARSSSRLYEKPTPTFSFDPLSLSTPEEDVPQLNKNVALLPGFAAVGALALFPESASAAVAGAPNAVGSALAAYGHYFSLIALVAILMYERLSIKPNMTMDEVKNLVFADSAYGIFGGLLAYTGYLRATQFEKGWDFYSHEPIFWVKMLFLGVYGASSFFNTTIIIKKGSPVFQDPETFSPIGERLAARMIQLCNAQATALAIIPLTATFMARGVAYSNSIPWQAEAAFVALVFGGLSYKYITEALGFEDDDEPAVQDI